MKPMLMLLNVIISVAAMGSMGKSFRPILMHEYKTMSDSTRPVSASRNANLLFFCSDNVPLSMTQIINENKNVQAVAGYTKQGRPLEIFYFPGTTDKRALVIGGMHGSELSSVEVAKALMQQLQETGRSHYAVIVIPCLFPDNAALASNTPSEIGGVSNTGRYTSVTAADPNRQMPPLGKPFDPESPFDFMKREIEKENQLLLRIINEFRPTRILNIHAIRNTAQAGVYADPRTDQEGYALGFDSDSSLAIAMANNIVQNGGKAEGNQLDSLPTARYQNDPCPAPCGHLQKRNLRGSTLPNKRGHGVSLGSWATTAIFDQPDPAYNRPAMRLMTMEFPGYSRPSDLKDYCERQNCMQMIDYYARSIKEIFLENHFSEEAHFSTSQLAVRPL